MKVHILNGDALAERFPTEIPGINIVCRECLIEGPLTFDGLDAFLQLRDEYLSTTYPINESNYYQKVVGPEFGRIAKLPNGAEIYLWFEEDLFCLMNAWFVLFLLSTSNQKYEVHWVHPPQTMHFGFAGLTKNELKSAPNHSIQIKKSDLSAATQLWQLITEKKYTQAADIQFSKELDFLNKGVEFLIDFKVNQKAESLLFSIISKYESPEFGIVFKEFHRLTPEYGLGDLQVKRLYDKLVTGLT